MKTQVQLLVAREDLLVHVALVGPAANLWDSPQPEDIGPNRPTLASVELPGDALRAGRAKL
jgi:hypothetical protein